MTRPTPPIGRGWKPCMGGGRRSQFEVVNRNPVVGRRSRADGENGDDETRPRESAGPGRLAGMMMSAWQGRGSRRPQACRCRDDEEDETEDEAGRGALAATRTPRPTTPLFVRGSTPGLDASPWHRPRRQTPAEGLLP